MNGIVDIEAVKAALRKNLKESRQHVGIRTLDVAFFLGMSPSAYSYYESGRSIPTLDNLLKLGALYNKGIDELLGWQDIMLTNKAYNRYNAEHLHAMERAHEYELLYKEKLNNITNEPLREWMEDELEDLTANQVQQLRLLWEILKLKEQENKN